MHNKILQIVGPTASGKTKLAVSLAAKIGGVVVSSDSRQMYKGFDIGTGKTLDLPIYKIEVRLDTPAYVLDNGVVIYGYDLFEPDFNASVFDYVVKARKFIEQAWERGDTPIIVGGTGLYSKILINGISSSPPNAILRKKLTDLTLQELTSKLESLQPETYRKLNDSDRKNKIRIIRALEKILGNKQKTIEPLSGEVMTVVLQYEPKLIKSKIERSIKKRLDSGFLSEVEKLVKYKDSQAAKATGYGEAWDFIDKKIDYDEFLDKWIRRETSYVKRQLTWFKKQEGQHIDVDTPNFEQKVEKSVLEWLK